MTHYETCLSISITVCETALCLFVFGRDLQKRLPFFAAYTLTMLASSLGLSFVFVHFGFRSLASYYASWVAVAVSVLARSGSIAELCRHVLRDYRGIWALSWRVLGLITLSFLIHAALDARGQPNWIAAYGLTVERDIAIGSAAVLIVLLLICDYYRLLVEPLQKWIALGICFFCAIEFVNNTVLRDLFIKYMFTWSAMKSQVDQVNEIWNTVQVSAALATMSFWCFALRKPLPQAPKSPVLLPAEIYRDLSPAIKSAPPRVSNDRLLEMLKP